MINFEVIQEPKEQPKGKAFIHRSANHNIFRTHYSLTEQLFEKEYFDRSCSILEPAAGYWDMVEVLRNHFDHVVAKELIHGADFYKETGKYDSIITNPPYGSETDRFVQKAKQVARNKFAFLLRTNYLSGQSRFESGIFDGLRSVYIFTRMPDLTAPIRIDGKYPTAGIVYAWFVWEIGYTGKPQFDWIDNQRFVLTAADLKEEKLKYML